MTTTEETKELLAEAISTLTGKNLFDRLKELHWQACSSNVAIVYPTENYTASGWRDFTIQSNRVVEIMLDASFGAATYGNSIRLGTNTDFKNFVFKISTNSANPPASQFMFFSHYTFNGPSEGMPQPILTKRDIDTGDFRNYSELKSGTYLLTLKDRTPWTQQTLISNPPFTYRKDILLVKDGIAQNRPIAPYDTMASDPEWASYRLYQTGQKNIKNVTLMRDIGSIRNVMLLKIINEDNIHIENVTIDFFNSSPQTLTGDRAIQISDSTNVFLKNININHVFSTENDYGYGINLENVWNVTVENLNLPYNNPSKPTPIWGVFGNNNVNTIKLVGCHLNRIDIHCYGRDIICDQCIFEAANDSTQHNFNRVSSFYGVFRFKGCTFTKFVPIKVDPDYNAFTGFDVYFEDQCTLTYRSGQYYLLLMYYLRSNINPRPELSQKCWPNVRVESMQITKNSTSFHIYNLAENAVFSPVGYLSWLNLSGLSFVGSPQPSLSACNRNVSFAQKVYKTMPGFTDGVYVDSF